MIYPFMEFLNSPLKPNSSALLLLDDSALHDIDISKVSHRKSASSCIKKLPIGKISTKLFEVLH